MGTRRDLQKIKLLRTKQTNVKPEQKVLCWLRSKLQAWPSWSAKALWIGRLSRAERDAPGLPSCICVAWSHAEQKWRNGKKKGRRKIGRERGKKKEKIHINTQKKQQTITKNPEPWVTRGLQPGVRLCANVAIFMQTKYILEFLFASLHTELHGTKTMLESSRAHMPQKYTPTWRTSLAPVHESTRRMKVIWRGMSILCASRLWHPLTQFTP